MQNTFQILFWSQAISLAAPSVKPGVKTGATLCLSDKLNFRSIYVTPGANSELTREDIDPAYINQAKMIHISSFVDERQFKVLPELIETLEPSVKVSFSPGMLYAARGLKALSPILARTYILFINESEIRQLTGEEFKAGAESCLKQGCHTVVVTLGKSSSHKAGAATGYIRTTEYEYSVQPGDKIEASAADTTGAGDAFAAGFLYGFLNGKGLEECGHLGNFVAQLSITKIGAREGLPTLDELSRRYHQLHDKPL